jgi:hypothetical protein
VLSVQVSPSGDSSVTTMSGTVTFVTDHGTFTIPYGQSSNGNASTSIADAVKANPALANEIIGATGLVAQAVGDGAVNNTAQSPNLITTVLAAVVDVAIQASPGNATDILKTVLTNASPALQGSNSSTMVNAITQQAKTALGNADPTADTKPLDAVAPQLSTDKILPNTTPPEKTAQPVLPPLDQTPLPHPPGTLVVKVVDIHGNPVAGATVGAIFNAVSYPAATTTDGSGTCTISGVLAGSGTVKADAIPNLEGTADATVTEGGTTFVTITLVVIVTTS